MPHSMSHLSAPLPCISAGRTTPDASPVSLLSSLASGRPWQLDDGGWLARRYAEDGDLVIAQELGCDKRTVRAARQRHGITSARAGRRRGRLSVVPADGQPAGELVLTGTALQIIARFNEDQQHSASPSEDLLAARIRAAHEARLHGDQLAYEDALLAISSAAALIHQHEQRLRGAA